MFGLSAAVSEAQRARRMRDRRGFMAGMLAFGSGGNDGGGRLFQGSALKVGERHGLKLVKLWTSEVGALG
jgi:hypothetical protein